MKELRIYEFQAKQIEDTLRIVERVLESKTRKTCLDRDVMQSWKMIQNVISGKIDERVNRDSSDFSSLIPCGDRLAVNNEVMKILVENCYVVDGQIKGVIVHGAVDKITDLIISSRKDSESHERVVEEPPAWTTECNCLKCTPNKFTNRRFNVCSICGNKRCPHAADHDFECTNSN